MYIGHAYFFDRSEVTTCGISSNQDITHIKLQQVTRKKKQQVSQNFSATISFHFLNVKTTQLTERDYVLPCDG